LANRCRRPTCAWLTAIAESTDDAIVGKDLRGWVTSWNKGAEAMFGYAVDEVIIPPPRIEEEERILDRVSCGERQVRFETTRRRKDGRIVPFSPTISPIHAASGAIRGRSEGIARSSGSGAGPPSVPSGYSRGEVLGVIQHTDQDGPCTRLLWRTRWPRADRNHHRPCGMRDRSRQPRRLGR
jgi:PAS domain S-box-containing protein